MGISISLQYFILSLPLWYTNTFKSDGVGFLVGMLWPFVISALFC